MYPQHPGQQPTHRVGGEGYLMPQESQGRRLHTLAGAPLAGQVGSQLQPGELEVSPHQEPTLEISHDSRILNSDSWYVDNYHPPDNSFAWRHDGPITRGAGHRDGQMAQGADTSGWAGVSHGSSETWMSNQQMQSDFYHYPQQVEHAPHVFQQLPAQASHVHLQLAMVQGSPDPYPASHDPTWNQNIPMGQHNVMSAQYFSGHSYSQHPGSSFELAHGQPGYDDRRAPGAAASSFAHKQHGPASNGVAQPQVSFSVRNSQDPVAAKVMVTAKRKKREAWLEHEHALFLEGLERFGRGDWRSISRLVETRTPTQIASHAQKYFLRLDGAKKPRCDESDPASTNRSQESPISPPTPFVLSGRDRACLGGRPGKPNYAKPEIESVSIDGTKQDDGFAAQQGSCQAPEVTNLGNI